jgi:anaerobic selenocysteine-containing dehydrogenase
VGDTALSRSKEQWVTTSCGMCTNECGINVHIENGKIVNVEGWTEHPHSRGRVCVKARQIPMHVYHDSRLKYPMRKEKDEWQRISWDETLTTIATKLKEGKERYGAASFGVLVGEPVCVIWQLGLGLIWRFCDVYGTPARFSANELCFIPNVFAQFATFGYLGVPDVENSNCIIVWGDNPHMCAHVTASQILNARARGAKLIVIDPRRIPLAQQADMHLQPRPGTDAILALAMINIIISEGLYDKEFVRDWTVGFDKLAEHVKQYTPEEAEQVSGVATEGIKKTARIFAATKPACIQLGNKINQTRSGFQYSRAVAILYALTGNIDVPGGVLRGSSLHTGSARLPDLVEDLSHVGQKQYQIYTKIGRGWVGDGCMTNWGDLVLNEPQQLRNVIVSGANPAITWPNTTKVRRAFDNLDLLVVMDVFMTATAEMADIVLPASTFLEKLGGLTNNAGWVLRRPIIEPQWESWSDCKFWLALARRMGYEQYFPWHDDEETFDCFLEPTGLTVKRMLEVHPDGFIQPRVMPGEQRYKDKGFRTPSGKVELYSEQLKEIGHEPLPIYLEPKESPISTPELFNEFPLILTTGTRELEWWHSQHRHLEGLRRRNPQPMAEIHPDTADKHGISDGELMVVETRTGSLEIKAKVTEDIIPGMVSVPHAWAEAPENVLTDDMPADPVSGFPAFTSLLCRVRKRISM